ncbi:hypothetical protein G5S52_09430 [Grimontia sp. S25]|uniref:Uncharacterized protein n=1 Tax=Grimontia sedimenti TaxID=2711294 RepID=A0A6M1RJG8_9GAMM|nr:hypothetical protein [Grimontia sedimenti]NGN97868.1 hypothetical protein [Grimontia sedimenti]
MAKQKPSLMHRTLTSTPVLGAVFAIANAYAQRGAPQAQIHIASLSQWWSRIFKKAFCVLVFVLMLDFITDESIATSTWIPADTILGAFPSILGFGIGVYALMFIMPSDFLTFLREKKSEGSPIGPEIVPVDMGYPLITYVLVMLIASICKVFPDTIWLKIASYWALFYGLAMTIELVSFLFLTSKMIQK